MLPFKWRSAHKRLPEGLLHRRVTRHHSQHGGHIGVDHARALGASTDSHLHTTCVSLERAKQYQVHLWNTSISRLKSSHEYRTSTIWIYSNLRHRKWSVCKETSLPSERMHTITLRFARRTFSWLCRGVGIAIVLRAWRQRSAIFDKQVGPRPCQEEWEHTNLKSHSQTLRGQISGCDGYRCILACLHAVLEWVHQSWHRCNHLILPLCKGIVSDYYETTISMCST